MPKQEVFCCLPVPGCFSVSQMTSRRLLQDEKRGALSKLLATINNNWLGKLPLYLQLGSDKNQETDSHTGWGYKSLGDNKSPFSLYLNLLQKLGLKNNPYNNWNKNKFPAADISLKTRSFYILPLWIQYFYQYKQLQCGRSQYSELDVSKISVRTSYVTI